VNPTARLAMLCVALAPLAVPAGCRTTEERRPVSEGPAIVRRALPERAWDVEAGGELLGRIVFFASPEDPALSLYVVRNLFGQDLGWVDTLGRAYQLVPHAPQPVWLGTGTVALGAERILEAEGPCTLVETVLETDAPAGDDRP